MPAPSVPHEPHGRLFLRFLRFGLLAWGGPVAQIAMIREELVEEERWVSRERFNRVLAVYQALPGPEAHELCVYFGRLAGGRLGGTLAGLGFMLPGFALMLVLSWAYVRFGIDSEGLGGVLAGVQAGVLALIARGMISIGMHALTSPVFWAIAAGTLAGELAGAHFAVVLLAAGAFGMLARRGLWPAAIAVALTAVALVAFVPALRGAEPLGAAAPTAAATEGGVALLRLFLAGLTAGLLTFGGAYTAIPVMRRSAAGPGGWVSESQFLDGLALGGILPAPLLIFITFIGYLGGGFAGAVVATAGVFLPAFAFTLVGFSQVERLVADERLHAFLDGVTAGVVGLIAGTTIRFVPLAAGDPVTAAIALASLAALLRWRGRAAIPLLLLVAAVAGHIAGLVL